MSRAEHPPLEPVENTSWSVYVLLSANAKRTYVGITLDPERRLEQHNGAIVGGAKATRPGRPWRIGKLYGPYSSRGEALRVEGKVKQRRGHSRLTWSPPESE